MESVKKKRKKMRGEEEKAKNRAMRREEKMAKTRQCDVERKRQKSHEATENCEASAKRKLEKASAKNHKAARISSHAFIAKSRTPMKNSARHFRRIPRTKNLLPRSSRAARRGGAVRTCTQFFCGKKYPKTKTFPALKILL